MSSPQTGSIEAAAAELRSWLGGVTDVPVRIGPPTDGTQSEISLWVLELRPEQQTRGTGAPPPFRFTIRLVVAAAGDNAFQLLDTVLAAAVQAGAPAINLDGLDSQVWTALGVAPRPVLLFDMPGSVDRPIKSAPLVLAPLQLKHLETKRLSGAVVGPNTQPVAGVRVEMVGSQLFAYTDQLGRFALPGVPAEGLLRLRVRGRGRVFDVEVPPADDEPLTIHCDFVAGGLGPHNVTDN